MDGGNVNGPAGAIGFVAIPACLRPVEGNTALGWLALEQRGDTVDQAAAGRHWRPGGRLRQEQ